VITPASVSLFDEVTDFLSGSPSAEEILAFRPSDAAQERATYLLEKNRKGTLSDAEQRELDLFSQANHLMRVLKAKVAIRLK
jgi:hypothetical protein